MSCAPLHMGEQELHLYLLGHESSMNRVIGLHKTVVMIKFPKVNIEENHCEFCLGEKLLDYNNYQLFKTSINWNSQKMKMTWYLKNNY